MGCHGNYNDIKIEAAAAAPSPPPPPSALLSPLKTGNNAAKFRTFPSGQPGKEHGYPEKTKCVGREDGLYKTSPEKAAQGSPERRGSPRARGRRK